MVDDELISIRAAVEVSFLSKEDQELVAQLIEDNPKLLSMSTAGQLKKLSNSGDLTEDIIAEVLAPKEKEASKTKSVKLPSEDYNRFFSGKKDSDEIRDTIVKALEFYFNNTSTDFMED